MTYQETITITTSKHGQMHDITEDVCTILRNSGIQTGICHIFNVGSTGAIGTIEYEHGLERDLSEHLDQIFPPTKEYAHEQTWHDGNGHSHLQATFLGPDLTVPVANQNLVLGIWQQIFHIECDIKPRTRTIVVTIIGD